jgi:dimethylhistidine N-methyltransferase
MPNDTALVPAASRNVADAALGGLLQHRKTLSPTLFYDEAGCRLFRLITELPEYYLTRTERSLLTEVAPQVVAALPGQAVLVEYGASDEAKASILLRERDRTGEPVFRGYVPIDVAAPALAALQQRLQRARPDLMVWPLTADFTQGVTLPVAAFRWPRLGFFPGSTIGNLDPSAAQQFLRRASDTLGDGSLFLVGFDLRKDPAVLVPAYDDAAGVTAAFNRNILVRLNREADADFDVDSFAHRAIWNDVESRIEMHLESRHDQLVQIAGHTIRFAEGETIHTENSYKYSPERFATLAAEAGWQVAQQWNDPQRRFSLHLLEQRQS